MGAGPEEAFGLWTPSVLHLQGLACVFLFASLPSGLCCPFLPFYFYIFSIPTPLTCSWFPCGILFCWALWGLCLHAAQWGPSCFVSPLLLSRHTELLLWPGQQEGRAVLSGTCSLSCLWCQLPSELPRLWSGDVAWSI